MKWPCHDPIEEYCDWKAYPYDELHDVSFKTDVGNYTGYIKKVKAKELLDLIIECAWKTAEPGILLWDNIINFDPASVYENLRAVTTNPCVSGDTKILTKSGYQRIDSLVGQKTTIWNGYEWSDVVPRITGYNQEILKIKFSDGNELRVTPYHKFILKDKSRVEARNLKIMML